MKGFLKGLKFIQQIFEDEQEPEMQIGEPTDVKHVAHIGWDGPTANAPSWMGQFKSETDAPGAPGAGNDPPAEMRMSPEGDARPPLPEKRTSVGPDSPTGSPSKRKSDKPKQSRRHNSAGSSLDSPKRSATESRRNANSSGGSLDSAAPAGAPKSSRRKKSKNSSGEASAKPAKSKNTTSATDSFAYTDGPEAASGMALKNKETCQHSVLMTSEDEKAMNEISTRIHAM